MKHVVTATDSTRKWKIARKEAAEVANYQENWDGEGAVPVPACLVASIIQLFRKMQRKGISAPDAVYPLAIGAVMAEWHYSDQTVVSAEIRKVGKAEVLVWHPNNPSTFETIEWNEVLKSTLKPIPLLKIYPLLT